MFSRGRGFVATVLLLGASAGCSGADGATGTTVSAIAGGQNDNTMHPDVVGIVLNLSNGVAICSGALLTPNLVLTARHCVSALSSQSELICQTFTDSTGTHQATSAQAPYAPSNFYVTTESQISQSANFVNVAEVLVPPNSTNVPMCGKDVAILRLETPITDVGLITPRLDLPPVVGEMFTAVGYGATNGTGSGAGTRRFRGGLSVQYLGPVSESGIQFVTSSEWIADTGTCEGDSGSPALDVLGQSFGVLSRGPAGACDTPIYTSVHAYADWIRSAATAAASAAGIAAPAWVTPPTDNSAHMGDPCTADTQCDEATDPQLACLVVGDQRRCSYSDCSLCPSGWICGADPSGASVCVPDPNAPPPDAGTPADDAASTPGDGGTGGDAGTGADSGTGGSMHGGCSAAPVRDARGGALALAGAGLALALVARRRRSRAAK